MTDQRDQSGNDSALFRDIVWGVEHDAFEGELERRSLRAWSLRAAKPWICDVLKNTVRSLRTKEAFGELIPYRKPRVRGGNLLLGQDADGDPVRMALQWLAAGLLMLANTGGGKSTLLTLLAVQVATSKCRVWITDLYKTQMRHLRAALTRVGVPVVVLRPQDWKFNPLQAGPRDPRAHLSAANDSLARTLGLQSRSRTILRQGGHELYRRFGVWDGRTDAWPCLFDLHEWVRTQPNLNAAAREAILDRLGALLTAMMPRCAAYRRAWDPVELANHSIVFEMRGTSETDKSVRLQSCLWAMLQHAVEQGAVNAPLRLWVCFEDAQRYFQERTGGDGAEIAPMDELAGVVRGAGIGLCLTAQTTHGLSRSLIPNMATKLAGRLGSQEDWQRMAAELAMDARQLAWARRHLQPGHFVGQASEGDWREPFLLRVPNAQLPCEVDDADAAESVKLLDALPTVPAEEYANWEAHPVLRVTPAQDSASPSALDDAERRFLEVVLADPGRPSSHYAKQTGLSGKRAAVIRARLVSLGLLREHQVATGARGRRAIVLEPLAPARDAVADARS